VGKGYLMFPVGAKSPDRGCAGLDRDCVRTVGKFWIPILWRILCWRNRQGAQAFGGRNPV